VGSDPCFWDNLFLFQKWCDLCLKQNRPVNTGGEVFL
jgi:hypothetical protein